MKDRRRLRLLLHALARHRRALEWFKVIESMTHAVDWDEWKVCKGHPSLAQAHLRVELAWSVLCKLKESI